MLFHFILICRSELVLIFDFVCPCRNALFCSTDWIIIAQVRSQTLEVVRGAALCLKTRNNSSIHRLANRYASPVKT